MISNLNQFTINTPVEELRTLTGVLASSTPTATFFGKRVCITRMKK